VGSVAVHDDLELYLTGRLRTDLAALDDPDVADIEVSNRWPDPNAPFPRRLLVIRDDSGPRTSLVTADRAVGYTLVYDDTHDTLLTTSRAARLVAALAAAVPGPQRDNPVAAVRAQNGPYKVDEPPPRIRFYSTITYSVAARPL